VPELLIPPPSADEVAPLAVTELTQSVDAVSVSVPELLIPPPLPSLIESAETVPHIRSSSMSSHEEAALMLRHGGAVLARRNCLPVASTRYFGNRWITL
jgi:hypothetical protein